MESKLKPGKVTAPISFPDLVDPFQIFNLVDVGKRGQFMINGPDFIDRDIEGVQLPDHRTQREGGMVFQIPYQCGSPVNRMQRLEHLSVPAGNGGIKIINPSEKMGNDPGIDTGHITGGNEEYLPARCEGSGMESAYGSCSRADVCYAPDSPDGIETPALLGIPCDKDNLVNNLRKGFDQPLDEGLSLVREEIFLLSVCTPCLSSDKDDC